MAIDVSNSKEEHSLLLKRNGGGGGSDSHSSSTTKELTSCVAIALAAVLAVTAACHYGLVGMAIQDHQQSPWCKDPNHPAVPGMYGDMGKVDLVGAKGSLGQYVDLPDYDAITVALFQQGLAHLYGFNQVEALRNMETAVKRSPNCVLCYWGVAMSYAPNINTRMVNQTKFNSAMEKALELSANQLALTRKTKTLIYAYSKLIVDPSQSDEPDSKMRAQWANALCTESSSLKDADMDTLCAAALMANTPWNYYQGTAIGKVYPLQPQLKPAKQKLLSSVHGGSDKGAAPHVLAIHLLIHLLEPTSAPTSYRWEALEPTLLLYNATSRTSLVPSQGHLTHMPAHLFVHTGLYREGVETSKVAIANNQRYSSQCLMPYAYAHNLKMLVVNARMAGMYEDAVYYAHLTQDQAAGTMLTPNGDEVCMDCAGTGSPQLVLTLARVARWAEILNETVPNDDWGHPELAAFNEASFHFTRALAWYGLATSLEDGSMNSTLVDKADDEAQKCLAAAPNAVSESNLMNASAHFPAELRAVRSWRVERDYGAAIQALEELVAVDDSKIYVEPPNLYYPPRHCLAVALLHAPAPYQDVPRALAVFREDLATFPENAWSLHGAADALDNLGMHRQARTFRTRATVAWKDAEFDFVSPCPQLVL